MVPLVTDLEKSSSGSSETCNFDNYRYIKYEVINYRGQTLEILSDLPGDNFYAKLNDEIIYLGYHNINYKEDLCRLIDRKLDLITTFQFDTALRGAQLSYFNNNGYRDIKLTYKGRLLKVFLTNGSTVDETSVISEAARLLRSSGLLENDPIIIETSAVTPILNC